MEKVSLEELLALPSLEGKVIVFPTDTVYGIAARVGDRDAIARIYALKKRDPSKPLAILVSSIAQAEHYYGPFAPRVATLLRKYWPGAFTLIVPHDNVTVGLRMPASRIALSILDKFGPLATTSVNISGEAEINSVDDIVRMFPSGIDYIVTDHAEFSGKPSTVALLKRDGIQILREGAVRLTEEELKAS